MQCLCRNCGKEYDNGRSRAEWSGFCSAKCQHTKAHELGFRKHGQRSEYQILDVAKCIGDVPAEAECVKLRAELADLKSSRNANPERIKTIQRLLRT